MKILLKNSRPTGIRFCAGYTLVEMMMVVGTSTIIMASVLALQFSTMRVATYTMAKLSAATSARQALNGVRDQVRCAQQLMVGNYTNGSPPVFSVATNGAAQTGNALQVFYDSTGTNYVIYYLDTTLPTNTFFSVKNSVVTTLAKFATNYNCFFLEDYQGNLLTNTIENPTIHVILQFKQWECPGIQSGTNGANQYNFYRVETRVSRRVR